MSLLAQLILQFSGSDNHSPETNFRKKVHNQIRYYQTVFRSEILILFFTSPPIFGKILLLSQKLGIKPGFFPHLFSHVAKPHQKFSKRKIALTPTILIDSSRNLGDDLRGIPSIAPPILKRSDRLVIEIIANRFSQISPKQKLSQL